MHSVQHLLTDLLWRMTHVFVWATDGLSRSALRVRYHKQQATLKQSHTHTLSLSLFGCKSIPGYPCFDKICLLNSLSHSLEEKKGKKLDYEICGDWHLGGYFSIVLFSPSLDSLLSWKIEMMVTKKTLPKPSFPHLRYQYIHPSSLKYVFSYNERKASRGGQNLLTKSPTISYSIITIYLVAPLVIGSIAKPSMSGVLGVCCVW